MQKVKNNYFNRKRGSLISVRLPLLSSQTRNNVLRKTRCSDLHLLVGLSEINSKNYDIILGKVKSTPITPVMNSSMSEYPDNAYNIKTETKQQ